jgi:hypothetical protein
MMHAHSPSADKALAASGLALHLVGNRVAEAVAEHAFTQGANASDVRASDARTSDLILGRGILDFA